MCYITDSTYRFLTDWHTERIERIVGEPKWTGERDRAKVNQGFKKG